MRKQIANAVGDAGVVGTMISALDRWTDRLDGLVERWPAFALWDMLGPHLPPFGTIEDLADGEGSLETERSIEVEIELRS